MEPSEPGRQKLERQNSGQEVRKALLFSDPLQTLEKGTFVTLGDLLKGP